MQDQKVYVRHAATKHQYNVWVVTSESKIKAAVIPYYTETDFRNNKLSKIQALQFAEFCSENYKHMNSKLKIIDTIKDQVAKLQQLAGHDYCQSVANLSENATEAEWIAAWNQDQLIIKSMINDMDLLCSAIPQITT